MTRQMTGALCSAMPRILFAKKIFHVQGVALACIERTDAPVYFSTKCVELLDTREQLPANLLLIGIRQSGNFRNGLFERSDHEIQPSTFATPARLENLERAKGIEPSYAAWEAAVLPLNYARGVRVLRLS